MVKPQVEVFRDVWVCAHYADPHGTMAFTLPDTPEVIWLKAKIEAARLHALGVKPAPVPEHPLKKLIRLIVEALARLQDGQQPRGAF